MRTTSALLSQRADTHASHVFLRFAGRELSYRQCDALSQLAARAFTGLGVGAGDLVAVLLPNCPEAVVTWFGANRIAAVAAPVNTAFRGPALAHALNLTGARVLVVDHTLVGALTSVHSELTTVRTLIVRGDHDATLFPQWTVLPYAVLEEPGDPVPAVQPQPADPALVLFTSGTTGRSKGCLLSHRFAVRQAELMVENFRLRADDVLYCPFPLFHLDATVMTVMPALVLGATAAIGERFSASGFWPEVRAMGATAFDFMGATLTILHKRQSQVDDRDHGVRLGWGVPMPEFAAEFEERFGVRLVEAYGSTDVGVPIYSDPDLPRRPGACGRPIPAYDVQVVDPSDEPVPPGTVGELVVRPNEPGLINDGYLGMPAESLAARRNLWFHTGDLVRRDPDGYVYFVGRLSDSIRRRGENISAFEVEEVVGAHPDVLEAAAYGVPSELTEEDVMVAVVPRPGRSVDPASLVAWCASRMARHMLPAYVDVVPSLPKTPTEKVEKHALKARGITPTAWSAG
ncbi:ATP-dependent acyl-CoA ligase [Virgisporangium ochraceum]|uniref:ATP-dependent acyl-CoA ligase n=1 Tax=Virgisporangium ochraceum TaxID=65505 RepID=A0A8J4A4W3_9ACTN|nr:AMP-binding protein [Virgisporangium ochraceum]GIJ74273.1 ATP-dependent acyl-CoA ligase [Virgisporangium ochraceum]